jgi:hypothetical protein
MMKISFVPSSPFSVRQLKSHCNCSGRELKVQWPTSLDFNSDFYMQIMVQLFIINGTVEAQKMQWWLSVPLAQFPCWWSIIRSVPSHLTLFLFNFVVDRINFSRRSLISVKKHLHLWFWEKIENWEFPCPSHIDENLKLNSAPNENASLFSNKITLKIDTFLVQTSNSTLPNFYNFAHTFLCLQSLLLMVSSRGISSSAHVDISLIAVWVYD